MYKLRYSIRRCFVDTFFIKYVPKLPQNCTVLDLGGNRIHKRGTFNIAQYNLNVIYANLSRAKQPTTQANAAYIPFKNNTFDAVICAELLEHVQHPPVVLRDVYRILKQNGTLLITVPFLYPIHGDPYDFGRYTDHYWLSILEEIGFEEITIERQGLFYSVLANFLKLYANRMYRRPIRNLASLPLALFQRWALQREQNPSVQSHPFLNSFTTGFGITAIKI